MSALSDAMAGLASDDAALANEVDQLIKKVSDIPGEVSAAVQAALTSAGVDDDAVRAAIVATDATVRASVAAAVAALTPPAQDTTTAPTPVDTPPAGDGTDTVSAPEGSDTSSGT